MMTEKEWSAIINDCRTSGISARVWCEKNGYKYTMYCYRNKKLNKHKQQRGRCVCALEKWLSDELMQKIAMENNLSGTAFTVKENSSYSDRIHFIQYGYF